MKKTANAKQNPPLIISGVVPRCSIKAELGPPRTECAAGALMPWADKLWVVSYVSSKGKSGIGTGLFEVDENLHMVKRPESVVGTYTNRMIHCPTNQLIIGPHVIDARRKIRNIESLYDVRICQTEHERFLMDCHGMFYELCPWAYDNKIWGVKPISTHLWVLGDFCTYRGMLVMGPDNASAMNQWNPLCAEPQSALWFGKTDDLWQLGKPSGRGGPWRDTKVMKGEPSDPYLMTGFDKKALHLTHQASRSVRFTVEVDFLGNGGWKTYDTISVPAGGYVHHEFPAAFSAHWVRLISSQSCVATAWFMYT